jgi:hypothetical protein
LLTFTFLGFLWLKNMIWAKKIFRLSRAGSVAVAVAVERKICTTPTA